jgi:hypothetical protein
VGPIDFIWGIGLFVAALGVAVLAFTPVEFRFARVCFWLAAILILGAHFMWQWTSDQPLGMKVLAAVIVCGFVGGGLAAGLGWIKKKLETTSAGAQPDVLIFPPVYRYKFTWRASSNLEMIILPERPPSETSPLRTAIPIFQIKNIGSAIAKDVTVEWSMDGIDLTKAVENSARLKGFATRFNDKRFVVFNGEAPEEIIAEMLSREGSRGVFASPLANPPFNGYVMAYSGRESVNIPYLAPELNNTGYQETDLPIGVCQFLELFVVATMSDRPPVNSFSSLSVPIDVSIKWASPEGGKPVRYKIIADVMSTKGWAMVDGHVQNPTPDIETEIKFTVSQAH